jgi:hypothetical protein
MLDVGNSTIISKIIYTREKKYNRKILHKLFPKLIILVFILIACTNLNCYDEALTLRLEGKVIDRVDRDSIPTVTLELWTIEGYQTKHSYLTSTKTDDKGYYSISYTYENKDNCGTYSYAIEASKQGYNTKLFTTVSQYCQISIECKENLQKFELLLDKTNN